jgi:hypothetical protein
VNNEAAQVFRRAERVDYALFLETLFERVKFACTVSLLHVGRPDEIVVSHEEYQARDSALDGAVVLHLRDGDVAPLRHVSVAEGEDAHVNVGLFNQASRLGDGVRVGGR